MDENPIIFVKWLMSRAIYENRQKISTSHAFNCALYDQVNISPPNWNPNKNGGITHQYSTVQKRGGGRIKLQKKYCTERHGWGHPIHRTGKKRPLPTMGAIHNCLETTSYTRVLQLFFWQTGSADPAIFSFANASG